jgi:hypothetical protein
MVIDINIDHNSGFWPIFSLFRPVFRMRSMVASEHIDHNSGCTPVFIICLIVIDISIDRTLGVLAKFNPKGAQGKKSGVRRQECDLPPFSSSGDSSPGVFRKPG